MKFPLVFLGLGRMMRVHWHTSWWVLGVWIVGMGALMWQTAMSISALYPTSEDIAKYAQALEVSSVMQAINGRIEGLNSLGGIVANEFAFFSSLIMPAMAVVFIVRMTRRDEQEGRSELLLAGKISRQVPALSATLISGGMFAVLAAIISGSLQSVGVKAGPANLYALGVFAVMCFFAGVALVSAQLMEHSRGAYLLSLGVIAWSFGVRGFGVVNDSAWAWLSPLTWADRLAPFADSRPEFLALFAIFVVAFLGLTLFLGARRDLGAGLITPRPGPKGASAWQASQFGVVFGGMKTLIMGWGIAGVFLASLSLLAKEATKVFAANPELAAMLGDSGPLVDGFLSYIMSYSLVVANAFAVSAVLASRNEESSGLGEAILSGLISRSSWLGIRLLVAATGTVIVFGASQAVLAACAGGVLDDAQLGWRIWWEGLTLLAVPLLFVALTFALWTWVPRWAPIAWVFVVGETVLSMFGEMLRIPDSVLRFSFARGIGKIPLESPDYWVVLGLVLAAIVLLAASFWRFNRRDITAA